MPLPVVAQVSDPVAARRRPPPLHLLPRKLSTVPEEDDFEHVSPPIPSILVSLWDESPAARTPSPRRDTFPATRNMLYSDTPVKRFRRLHYPGSIKAIKSNSFLTVPGQAIGAGY